eukprot:scpid18202/ scgid1170/ ETS translocation variant 3; ETS domain transcriptional repressor PE1; Mitogenic Ets transcriptional suppressor
MATVALQRPMPATACGGVVGSGKSAPGRAGERSILASSNANSSQRSSVVAVRNTDYWLERHAKSVSRLVSQECREKRQSREDGTRAEDRTSTDKDATNKSDTSAHHGEETPMLSDAALDANTAKSTSAVVVASPMSSAENAQRAAKLNTTAAAAPSRTDSEASLYDEWTRYPSLLSEGIGALRTLTDEACEQSAWLWNSDFSLPDSPDSSLEDRHDNEIARELHEKFLPMMTDNDDAILKEIVEASGQPGNLDFSKLAADLLVGTYHGGGNDDDSSSSGEDDDDDEDDANGDDKAARKSVNAGSESDSDVSSGSSGEDDDDTSDMSDYNDDDSEVCNGTPPSDTSTATHSNTEPQAPSLLKTVLSTGPRCQDYHASQQHSHMPYAGSMQSNQQHFMPPSGSLPATHTLADEEERPVGVFSMATHGTSLPPRSALNPNIHLIPHQNFPHPGSVIGNKPHTPYFTPPLFFHSVSSSAVASASAAALAPSHFMMQNCRQQPQVIMAAENVAAAARFHFDNDNASEEGLCEDAASSIGNNDAVLDENEDDADQQDDEEDDDEDDGGATGAAAATKSVNVRRNTVDPSHRHSIPTQMQLWEYILHILELGKFRQCINWINPQLGSLRIHDSVRLGKQWGIYRHKTKMNYDKMSRAMRYYYKRNIFVKIEGRLVYQFSEPVMRQVRGYRKRMRRGGSSRRT